MMKRQIFTTTIHGVLAVIVLLMLGCGRKADTPESHLARAKDYKAAMNYPAAIIELKNALQAAPNNIEARRMLGTLYLDIGDGASADKELHRALELGVPEDTLRVELARAQLYQGKLDQVLALCRNVQNYRPDKQAALIVLRGDALRGLKQTDKAAAAYAEALRLQPGMADAVMGQAYLAMMRRDMKEALRLVDVALEKSPESVQGWIIKGDILRQQNKKDEALSAYQMALKKDPGNMSAHLALASLYLADNKLDLARKEIDSARVISPNNLLLRYQTALLDFRGAKFAGARDELQQVLKIAPNHMPSVLLSGATAYALGSYEQAETYLSNYLNQNPADVYARNMLAATLMKTQQVGRALDVIKPILSDRTRDLQTLEVAGEIYVALKEYGKAADYFSKAAAIDPKNVDLRTALGMSQLATGDTERALAELGHASALDASQYNADTVLTLALLGKKEYDKALQSIAALEKKQPKNPLTYNLKGAAYLGRSDEVNARKCFEQAIALQPTNISAAMNLAQLDLKDKHPETARKRFEDILAKDKSNVQAMLALADLAAHSGQEQEYVGWLEKAAKANPTALQPPSLLARYYVRKQDLVKALRWAHEAQTANPDNPDALDLLGSVQFVAGEKDNALVTYTRLVSLVPKSPLAFFNLAMAQSALKTTRAAKESFKKALELKPDYLDAHVALASLELQDGNLNEATKIAQLAQRQYPRMPVGFVLDGDVLMAMKNYGQAVVSYEKAFSLGKSGTIAIKLHQAQILAGNVNDADAKLLQWLKEQPKDVATRVYLAQSYMTRGQNNQAIEQYQQILRNEPGDALALNNLAWLYYQANDPRALDIAEQGYKLKPDTATIADTYGWILLEQGKTARGVEILQKAAGLAPANLDIGYHYAVALAKAGNSQKARQQLEALLGSGRSFPNRDKARTLLNQL